MKNNLSFLFFNLPNSELWYVHCQRPAAADQLPGGAAALGQPPPQTHPEEAPDYKSSPRSAEQLCWINIATLSTGVPKTLPQKLSAHVGPPRGRQDPGHPTPAAAVGEAEVRKNYSLWQHLRT